VAQDEKVQVAADRLCAAYETGKFCEPVRDLIGLDLGAAYQVQSINAGRWLEAGRRIVGRKIGLTSKVVQDQLGVDQPDFGVLFADMEFADGDTVPVERTHQPKAEAEVALVIGRALPAADLTLNDLIAAVDHAVPAIEIVGSRIANWDIRISDTIADNASSGLYVIGGPKRSLDGLDLAGAGMVMKRNGEPVSQGSGAACLGNPLNAALWLARKCAALGMPLEAGSVVLTGALGPMVEMVPGDVFEASIDGLGTVTTCLSGKDE